MSLSLDYRILKMSKGDSAYDLTYSETLEVCRMMRELEEERNLLRQKLEAAEEKIKVDAVQYKREIRDIESVLSVAQHENKLMKATIREAREQKPVAVIPKDKIENLLVGKTAKVYGCASHMLYSPEYHENLFLSPVPAMPIQDDIVKTLELAVKLYSHKWSDEFAEVSTEIMKKV